MRYLLTASFCFCVFLVAAQKTATQLADKASISISPLALADVDNGIMLGGEYRFNARYAVVLDASYLFQSYYISRPENVSGFTVRPAFRFYPNRTENNSFVQVQAFYKQVDYRFYGWLDKGLVNNVPTYSQLQNFTYKKDVWGVNFMGGYKESVGAGRFYLELAGGVGIRMKQQGVTEPNSRFREQQSFGIYREKMTTFSLPCNIKLVYAFSRQ